MILKNSSFHSKFCYAYTRVNACTCVCVCTIKKTALIIFGLYFYCPILWFLGPTNEQALWKSFWSQKAQYKNCIIIYYYYIIHFFIFIFSRGRTRRFFKEFFSVWVEAFINFLFFNRMGAWFKPILNLFVLIFHVPWFIWTQPYKVTL